MIFLKCSIETKKMMQNTELTSILENIDRELKKAFSAQYLSSLLSQDDTIYSESIQTALATHILTPCLDVMRRGGKRLRPVLTCLLTKMLKGDEKAAYKAAPIIEGIHTASLIHDDIEDSSFTRRGEQSVHIKYGVDVALNAASALYFFSINLIETQKDIFKLPLYKECANALSLLHLGQAMDIKHHSDYNIPFNSAIYEKIASLKTGTLFSLAMKASFIFSRGGFSYEEEEEKKACDALDELGVSFQMFDDLINISSGNKGKDRGDDIVEGKLSFPIVLYLEKDHKNKDCILQFFCKAKTEGITSKAVSECCSLLEASGALQEGLCIAKEKMSHSFSALQSIFASSPQLDMMRDLFEQNVKNILKDM